MNRAIRVLSVSLTLLIIAVCAVFVLVSPDRARERPVQTQELSQKASEVQPPVLLSELPSGGQSVPEADTRPVAPPKGALEELTEPGAIRIKFLEFSVSVTHQGKPVVGAMVYSCLHSGDPSDGVPLPSGQFYDPSAPRASKPGLAVASLGYPEGTDPEWPVAVFVYQPDVGLAYKDYSLKELSTLEAEDLVFELEPGGLVTGIVVDPDGAPISGALVSITTQCTSGINLSGLATLTDELGVFNLRGILLDNVPASVYARRPENVDRALGRVRGERRVRRRQPESLSGVPEQSFDKDSNTWDIGEITLAMPAEK